ncbi:MAG: lysophospholipid acyltransferase family protein [Planctomycetota bacterium]
MTGDDQLFLEPAHDARVARFFSWWSRDKMVAKKFTTRLALGSRGHLEALAEHDGPVIALANHVCWWDPLVTLALQTTFWPDRRGYAPMDIDQLRKLKIFRTLGMFGVNPDDPRSLDAMSDFLAREFAQHARPAFWITPQGRFEDVRTPIEVRPGAAKIAADAVSAGLDVRCVAMALEYVFWLDPKPEILIRVEPVEPDRTNTPGWLRAMRGAMRTNGEALAKLAMARDPGPFENLLGGDGAKINPLYDLWLRLRGKRADLVDRSRTPAESPPR